MSIYLLVVNHHGSPTCGDAGSLKTRVTFSRVHTSINAADVTKLKGSMKEPNMFHNSYETEKITRKASDAAENLQLYRVVRFFCPRSLCTMMHSMLFSERPPIYASCMTISGWKNRTTWYNCRFSATSLVYEWFSSAENVRRYMHRAWGSRVWRTEQHVIGFGELAAVD